MTAENLHVRSVWTDAWTSHQLDMTAMMLLLVGPATSSAGFYERVSQLGTSGQAGIREKTIFSLFFIATQVQQKKSFIVYVCFYPFAAEDLDPELTQNSLQSILQC